MKSALRIESMLAIASLLAVALLWRQPIMLALIVASFGGLYIYMSTHRRALFVYIGAGLAGALSEVVAIYFGAWHYAAPQFLSIPLWLPFLWGNAALFILAMARVEHTE